MQRETIAWTSNSTSYTMLKYELSPHSFSPKTKPQHLNKDSLYVSLSNYISFCCSLARLVITEKTMHMKKALLAKPCIKIMHGFLSNQFLNPTLTYATFKF